MDRFDEKKDRVDADEMERTGDVLGLGGGPVPQTPADRIPSTRRGERALEEDETLTPHREDPYRRTPGATGIDMGAGGSGTDIDRD
jgi:hypothetical protein